MLKITTAGHTIRFEVHAKPRAKKSEVCGVREGALDVRLAAPPVDGAANTELVSFLAKSLGIPKSRVTILRGESSRTKLVSIEGLTPDALTPLTQLGSGR